MKNNLPILKFVLIASGLVTSLACPSQNQNNVNTTNVVVKTSPTPLPTRKPPANPKKPKDVCAYLSPDLRAGDYSAMQSGSDIYRCEAKKTELFDSGKGAQIVYAAAGAADYVRTIKIHVVVDGTPEEKLKWEKRFVELVEKLWQKAFAKLLPEDFKTQLVKDLGKPQSFIRKFEAPVETEIRRDAKGGDHLLAVDFYVDKDYISEQ